MPLLPVQVRVNLKRFLLAVGGALAHSLLLFFVTCSCLNLNVSDSGGKVHIPHQVQLFATVMAERESLGNSEWGKECWELALLNITGGALAFQVKMHILPFNDKSLQRFSKKSEVLVRTTELETVHVYRVIFLNQSGRAGGGHFFGRHICLHQYPCCGPDCDGDNHALLHLYSLDCSSGEPLCNLVPQAVSQYSLFYYASSLPCLSICLLACLPVCVCVPA